MERLAALDEPHRGGVTGAGAVDHDGVGLADRLLTDDPRPGDFAGDGEADGDVLAAQPRRSGAVVVAAGRAAGTGGADDVPAFVVGREQPRGDAVGAEAAVGAVVAGAVAGLDEVLAGHRADGVDRAEVVREPHDLDAVVQAACERDDLADEFVNAAVLVGHQVADGEFAGVVELLQAHALADVGFVGDSLGLGGVAAHGGVLSGRCW